MLLFLVDLMETWADPSLPWYVRDVNRKPWPGIDVSVCWARMTAVRSVDLDQGNEPAAPWRHKSEEGPLHRKVLAVMS